MKSTFTTPTSTKPDQDALDATLVDQLNILLRSLNIPITLISPTDLTPSLLIAILESMMGMRIPLVDRNKATKKSKASRVQNMKIFLGVLETDIIRKDVGLSDIDPSRLADGERDETIFVAEVLCWTGKQLNSSRKGNDCEQVTSAAVSPQTTIKLFSSSHRSIPPVSPKSQLDLDAEELFQGGSNNTRSMFSSINEESRTFPHLQSNYDYDSEEDDDSDALSSLPLFATPDHLPASIQEPSTFSLLFSENPTTPFYHSTPPKHHRDANFRERDNSFFFSPPTGREHLSRASTRSNRCIEPVDEEMEIASFETSRSMFSSSSNSSRDARRPPVKVAYVKEQYMRTLELLNERARLLTQLAEIKSPHR